MSLRNSLTLGIVFLASAFTCPAGADVSSSSGRAEFDAVGPAGMAIVGKTSEVQVREEAGRVSVTVTLANVDTGIALRNKHMREKYLEVGKYPVTTLSVERSSLRFDSGTATATGALTLHGKTKAIPFSYTVVKRGAALDVVGRTRIDMRDFGVDVPSYLGVSVKPEVDVVVSFTATDG